MTSLDRNERENQGRSRPAASPRPRPWAATLALLATGMLPSLALAAGPKNVVYVESNDPAGNAILAYSRAADGSLTPLPGSPFKTGGLGVSYTTALGTFDSDQDIITNPSGTLLFAVNGGSNSIAVFNIAQDGSLTPVAGSPFPSGGSQPSSLGLASNLLCVVNKNENPGHTGESQPNYTSFLVDEDGRLTPVKNSTIPLDNGSDPSQALIAPNGRLMFGADFLGGLLRSFQLRPSGRLNPVSALPLPEAEFADSGKPPLPLGLAVHPTRPLLYVGFVTINRIGIYRYSHAGDLTFLRSVPDTGSGVCWLLLNKSATRMYTSNTGDPSVSVYDMTDPTEPVEIQKLNVKGAGGPSNPGGYQIALDPSGQFFQMVTQQFATSSTAQANALHTFSVAGDGTVTEVPSSPTILPVPNQTRPQGVLAF